MTECGGSTLPRRQLGRHLRNGREALGLTLADVGALMEWSISTVQRMEVGKTDRIRLADVVALCRIYEFSDEFTEVLKGLALQASGKTWWHEYGDLIPEHFDVFVDLESSARRLTTYEPEIVPGIVQIPTYVRALMQTGYPDEEPGEVERRVRLRIERQVKVTRKARPVELRIVLREAALRAVVGGTKTMSGQLRYLADLSTRPNIDIRVLPFSAGFPLGVAIGPFVILDPGGTSTRRDPDPTVVYVECFTGDLYLEKEATVRRYAEAYQTLLDAALDPVQSRDMLRRVAKEYAP
ncbi:helix-turn-helix domain-containing protein [Nocardia carnea]|uniref:helix-turn-helix domain-containing protein n=1 Tax=Nocardia carnea TaxID=37328 RepID=UPI002455A55A|nr:helix-turn-helix transcriptional regulator [Nocardia carnea]